MVKWLWTGLLILATSAAPLSADAQTRATSADLTGVVLDESKAVLPGVTVTTTNVETNLVRSVVTDANQIGFHIGGGDCHAWKHRFRFVQYDAGQIRAGGAGLGVSGKR